MRLNKAKKQYKGECAVALVDISGFTALSETLAYKGKQGAEELTMIINGIFAVFIDIVRQWGGEIIHFSGDAISIIVYKDDFPDYKSRSIMIAYELSRYVKEHNIIYTQDGTFSISVHCGLSSGTINREIIDYNKQVEFIYYGILMNRAAVLLDKAQKGEIALDKSFSECECSFTIRDDYIILNRIEYSLEHTDAEKQAIRDDVKYNNSPIDKDSMLLSSHRNIIIIFINILIEENQISRILLNQYLSIINRFNAYHDKFDFAHTGIKSMIVLGAPKAAHDMELKALYLIKSIKSLLNKNNVNHRIGVHSGHAFCCIIGNELRSEYTVMGDTVNTAARIMAMTENNHMLISGSLYDIVSKNISLQSSKNITLRGKQQSNELYEFDGSIMPRMDDYWTKVAFIGRKEESDTALKLLQQTIEGKVNGLCISGQSGSGKTMFIKHIIEKLEARAVPIIIKCSEFNSKTYLSSLWDILTVISAKKINNADDIPEYILSTISLKSREIISEYFIESDEKHSDDNILLYSALSEVLDKYFSEYPLIIIIDDYQWIDDGTAGFIEYYRNDMSRKAKLIILSTSDASHYHGFNHITLKPFSGGDIDALIIGKYHSNEIARQLTDMLLNNSDGNPLIINDILSMLEENRCIEKHNEHYRIHLDRVNAYITSNTQSFLSAFLDTLENDARYVISVLSLFGDRLSKEEYSLLTGRPYISSEHLPQRHIIFEGNYMSFRNDITRRAVYNTLPYSFKEDMHYRILQLIEKSILKRNREFVINHLIMSKQYEKALPLCIESAEENKDICAYKTALFYYDMGLECLSHMDDPKDDILKLFRKDI